MKNKSENLKANNLIKALFILIITTTAISTLSISRFQTQISGNEGDISVAVFSVNAEGQEDNEFFLGYETNTDKYIINVTNSENNKTSEVSIKYDVIITVPKALVGLELDIDGKNPEVSSDGLTYTFENVGTFEAGVANTNTHNLTLTANYDFAIGNTYSGINISVYTEQIN